MINFFINIGVKFPKKELRDLTEVKQGYENAQPIIDELLRQLSVEGNGVFNSDILRLYSSELRADLVKKKDPAPIKLLSLGQSLIL
jgi:hypothetical protein